MAGEKPWPQVPVRNESSSNAAVVIIGAGLSGICTAIDLIRRNNCQNFIILEKSTSVGGTWYDNKYPGCCCDVWSMLYSYSFEQKSDWTRLYPGQEEILEYVVNVAEKYGLFRHMRFNSAVEGARWDDDERKWKVKVSVAKGSKEAEGCEAYTISSDFLVSAVGQLNQPKWPDIVGLDEFGGKVMHSARWDWTYDLKGKNIGLIGNGCTAVQILPELTKVANHVTLFQRTPNWVTPRLDTIVSPLWRSVFKYLPPVRWRIRGSMMDYRETVYDAVMDSESDLAQLFRSQCKEMLQETFPNNEQVREKLTPTYSPGCKRLIISDDYYPALAKENVKLETRPIDKVTKDQVLVKREEDGVAVESYTQPYDLIVCATGFKTTEFMHPIAIYGREGKSLKDVWSKGARAYMGTCIEELPNFGMLYGPNTNLGHNSIILMIEAQSRYINGLIKTVLDVRKQGKSLAVSPKLDKVEEYNREVQKVLLSSSFNDPNCDSWYKNENGMITNNWKGTVVEYQKLLSTVNLDEYNLEGDGKNITDKIVHVGRVREETYLGDTMLMVLSAVSVAAVAGGWLLRNSKLLRGPRVNR
ncbi:FAD/NAD(P)-binding domain-containing protein [Polychaeton citri CBS 116435]|uniref:FAD/NAD(P)-binding domain-containing protein n=1 Tax=Polychaeton citri CBS 116435 TaxID=1314669 RepID=A0A9P4QFJ4_9PEZI|nr:FAD/NAD(P)-binding domain-containing protein [Polychaeton citri CBS 116435]